MMGVRLHPDRDATICLWMVRYKIMLWEVMAMIAYRTIVAMGIKSLHSMD